MENNYNCFFLNHPEPCFIASEDSMFIEVNKAFVDYFGLSSEDWSEKSFRILFKNVVEYDKIYASLVKEKSILQKKVNLKTTDDKDCPASIDITIQKKEDNLIFSGIVHLVKEEVDLNCQLDDLQRILDAIPAAVFSRDRENKFIWANRYFLDITGKKREDVIGQNMFNVFPGQASGYFRDDLEVMVTGRTKKNIVETLQTKDGLRWFSTQKMPYYDPDGKLIGVLGFSADITPMKDAERALRASEEKYRAVAETTVAGICIMDEAGRFYFVNPAFANMVGYEEGELSDLPVDTIFDIESLNEYQSHIQLSNAPPKEMTLKRKDGSLNQVLISGSHISVDSRNRLCTLAVIVDISDRKNTEEILKQRTKELENHLSELRQIAYISSHDLKEPLRSITSFIQLLQKRYKGKIDQEADEFIEYAVEGVSRMQFLLNDLLVYSQISLKSTNFQKVDSNQIVDSVQKSLTHLIDESEASISFESLPVIQGDPKLLENLFNHLIKNALIYRNDHPPEIDIQVKRMNETWEFEVKDNGIGIDMQYAERIFNIFQRLHNRETYPGNGIGLSICQKIVEKHGGKIWVESKSKRGTSFYFTIPVNHSAYQAYSNSLPLEDLNV